MTISTVAHLNFRGDARPALAFYQSVFGGDQVAISYADTGHVPSPAEADNLMWGMVTAASGFRIMAYDVPSHTPWSPGETPFFVSVRGTDAAEITGYWTALSDGAAILQPIAASAWSPLYGMLRDRFGITWVLDVETAFAPA